MRLPIIVLPLALLTGLWPLAGWTQDPAPRLEAERRALADWHAQQQALCYRQFAVEDCLRDLRVQARQREQALREQELNADLQQRQAKAQQRREAIAEKERAAQAAQQLPPVVKVRPEQPAPAAKQRTARVPKAAPADAAQRAESAAQARQRQEEKIRQAERRRQRHAQQQKTEGERLPAAALPVPGQ